MADSSDRSRCGRQNGHNVHVSGSSGALGWHDMTHGAWDYSPTHPPTNPPTVALRARASSLFLALSMTCVCVWVERGEERGVKGEG